MSSKIALLCSFILFMSGYSHYRHEQRMRTKSQQLVQLQDNITTLATLAQINNATVVTQIDLKVDTVYEASTNTIIRYDTIYVTRSLTRPIVYHKPPIIY